MNDIHVGETPSRHPRTASRRSNLYIAGDSTATTRSVDFLPMLGWGQVLPLFFSPDTTIVNCARGRASSKSFMERGRLQWIVDNLTPGDLVLVSLGTIDRLNEPGLHTTPFGDFQEILSAYVTQIRSAGGCPVLVTPHERRRVDSDGNLTWSLADYVLATHEVAEAELAPLVDLYGQSILWWQELGDQGTREVFVYLRSGEPKLPWVQALDDGHLRAPGGLECARYIARSLSEQGIVDPDQVVDLHRTAFDTDELGWLDRATHDERIRSRVSTPAQNFTGKD
ncbi:GDSL-type esterase/lipase family protein [Streptomyces fractus]|uniref:GDSL-type esterase/lipase family protein n=1 Tax=Streptomyces fractus TaxID=641806 RepID=UPI003CEDAF95